MTQPMSPPAFLEGYILVWLHELACQISLRLAEYDTIIYFDHSVLRIVYLPTDIYRLALTAAVFLQQLHGFL